MQSTDDTTRIFPAREPATSAQPQTPPAAATATGSRRARRGFFAEAWRWVLVLSVTAMVALCLFGASLLAAIYWQARSDETRPSDAIVVLGTAQYNGRPSPVLRARLDEALAAYDAGAAPLIVVTGGGLEGDVFTEAEASRDYLVEQGVPESAILLENEGSDSWESMQGAADLLEAEGLSRVLVVSDGFHLLRLKLMARELGLDAAARPASESPIRDNGGTEFGYVVREAGAIVLFAWDAWR